MLTTLLLNLALALPAFEGDLLTLTDVARVRQITEVVALPDGAGAIYSLRTIHGDVADRDADVGYRTHLWRYDAATGAAYALSSGERTAGDPAISPDGTTLAFVRGGDAGREGEGRPQVWLLRLDRAGEARQLTEFEDGASSPQWFPDGAALLVNSSVGVGDLEGLPPFDSERPGRTPVERSEEDEELEEASDAVAPDATLDDLRDFLATGADAADPTVAYDLDFQGELGLAGEGRRSHLWRVDLATGAATELTRGWRSHGGAQLSPDGKHVVFAGPPPSDEHPDRIERSALWRLELAAEAEPRLLFDDEGWSAGSPRWSLDGEGLWFTVTDRSQPTFGQVELAHMPSDGAWERVLPELDRHVQGLTVVDDGGSEAVLFRCPSEGRVRVMRYALGDTAASPLLQIDGAVTGFDFEDGALFAAATTAADPSALLRLERASGRIEARGTDGEGFAGATSNSFVQTVARPNAWVDGLELPATQWRWTEAPDGTHVQYWVIPPAGLEPGRSAPVVLSLHGGPMVMWGPGSLSMWHEWHWLSANGYGVVYPNQRGSNGYGRAFQRANYRNWGAGPASDALAAFDAAADEFDWIDTDRAVVTGGSYAGYLTAWIVGHDDRFDAAVAQRGVYDLTTFFGEGNAWRLVPYHFGGYPWEPEVREILMRESPFTYVDRITTPLLIMHASQDLRTGVSQSEMLYRALKVLERPVEYVRYPDAGHDLSRTGDPHQRMDRLGRILEFFERYVTH